MRKPMSAYPIPSMLDAKTQTFPVLTRTQVDRARQYGEVRKVKRGDILFKPGDVNVPFFILLSGSMEIVQPAFAGDKLITTHDADSFTGELSMISEQRCLVLGRVTEPGEFLEISAENLRSLV